MVAKRVNTHSGLDDVLGTSGRPGDVGGVALVEDGDGLASNEELSIFGVDVILEAAVDGVVLEHVDLRPCETRRRWDRG